MSKSILNEKSILAVDDEPDILAVLEQEIMSTCDNCVFDKAMNYDEALRFLRSKNYDLIILDIMGVRGFDLLEISVKNNLKAIMLTAHALSPESLKHAYDMGARAYLPKQKLGEVVPFLEDVLRYDFEPGWKRLYQKLYSHFDELFGQDWEKLVGVKWPRWD
jgi:DNA-binding response OmpR family regulator